MSTTESDRDCGGRSLIAGVLLTLLLPMLAVPPAASAPGQNDTATTTPEPDHGADVKTLDRLWAGSHGNPPGTGTPLDDEITDAVDHVFTAPQAAAEQWTAGEHREFPATDAETAVVPAAATPTNRAWIRDTHLTICS